MHDDAAGPDVKPGACLHPKMLRLADLLLPHAPGLPGAYAVDVARARMDDFWNWFWGRYRDGEFRDGRLAGLGASGVAQAARWSFDPAAFVEAACVAVFLERDADGCLRVHDHEDHAPDWVRQALRDEARRTAPGRHSHAGWLLRVAFHGWRCWYCRAELTPATLTKDHRQPIARGGSNWPSNLVPACAACNGRKRAADALAFRARAVTGAC